MIVSFSVVLAQDSFVSAGLHPADQISQYVTNPFGLWNLRQGTIVKVARETKRVDASLDLANDENNI